MRVILCPAADQMCYLYKAQTVSALSLSAIATSLVSYHCCIAQVHAAEVFAFGSRRYRGMAVQYPILVALCFISHHKIVFLILVQYINDMDIGPAAS